MMKINRGNTGRMKGFTLIELLVVIGIIGVLTSMAGFNFQQARIRARDVQRKSDLKQLQNALEMYKNDQAEAHYPESLNDLVADFIKKVPVDPKEYKLDGSWVDYYFARSDTSVLEYDLVTCLENEGDVGRDETNNDLVCTQGVSYTLNEP